MTWTQVYNPLGHWWLSTLIAAVPIVLLLVLLARLSRQSRIGPPSWGARDCRAGGYRRVPHADHSRHRQLSLRRGIWPSKDCLDRRGRGLSLRHCAFDTGQFEIMKRSVAAITPDRRLQLLLVAFCFGAIMEGAAGFGAPVAIAGAFMIGLGTNAHAAALNLIANTAFRGMGRHRHASSHAGGRNRAARVRPECHDWPHSADHSGIDAGLAGARHGWMGGDLRGVFHHHGCGRFIRGHAIPCGPTLWTAIWSISLPAPCRWWLRFCSCGSGSPSEYGVSITIAPRCAVVTKGPA